MYLLRGRRKHLLHMTVYRSNSTFRGRQSGFTMAVAELNRKDDSGLMVPLSIRNLCNHCRLGY